MVTVEDPRLAQIRALCDYADRGLSEGPTGWVDTVDIRAVLDAPPVDATPEERALAADFDTEFTIRNAGRPPQGIDRDTAEDLLNEVWADCHTNRFTISQWVDRIEALVRPVEGVTLTPEEAELAVPALRHAAARHAAASGAAWRQLAADLRALASRLEAAQ